MTSPVSIAQTIFSVGLKIYAQVEQAKVNQEQSRCLAQRVQIINNTVRELVNSQDPPSLSVQVKILAPTDNRYFVDGLNALKGTLEGALRLVTSFSENSWFKRVIRSGTDNEKFARIYVQLETNINQLNLGINVQQLMDKKEEKEAAQKDWAIIQSKQDEILRLNQEAKKNMQKLAIDEESRHNIVLQQLKSMQFAIKQLKEGKQEKPLFSQKLIVPFHELNVDGLIDKGSFGEVYKGRYLEQEVAIKMLKGTLTPLEKEEFIREVKIMKQLRNEYVMQLDGVCFEPDISCIIMKYMKEGTLTDYLKKAPLTLLQKHHLALGIAIGLHYLHKKGIVHRDLKGGNVLIDERGNPRIADYGLSKALNSSSIMTISKGSTALEWLAPEIVLAEDNQAHTHKTDIYSYGTLLWHIMTEKTPYSGLSTADIAAKLARFELETIPQEIPTIYREIIQKCWSKETKKRPSLVEIIQKLRENFPPKNPSSDQGEDYYHAGIGYETYKQHDKARICYEKAIHLGHNKAKTNLAYFYLRGQGGITQDKKMAHTLFSEAAQGGHVRAMQELAKQLSLGDGVAKDESQAKFWQQKSKESL